MRKGISPLISVVLLVVATIAIGTLIINWMSSYTKETTGAVSNQSTVAINCSSANIEITDVYINYSTAGVNSNITRAIIKNVGFTDLTIKNAYVYNSTGGSCNLSGLLTLAQGDIITYSNTTGCPDTINSLSECENAVIRVSTDCAGIGHEFSRNKNDDIICCTTEGTCS